MISLEGRVALVTGGGRGIGRAHSLLLAELGARVVVCDRGVERDGRGHDTSVARAVVDEITAAGAVAVADDNDVSTFAGGDAVVANALDAFGRLDIVVNNAGIAGGSFDDDPEAALSKSLAVNFVGAVGVTHAAWASLAASGQGRIVNTVSEAAWPNVSSANIGLDRPQAGMPVQAPFVGYASAKAAVWSATMSCAVAGAPYGITANAVSPGAFTRMNEEMFQQVPPPPGLDLDPMHVARVVAWLASDDAADVTGRVIHAAGGQLREYVMSRLRDTELVTRVQRAVSDLEHHG